MAESMYQGPQAIEPRVSEVGEMLGAQLFPLLAELAQLGEQDASSNSLPEFTKQMIGRVCSTAIQSARENGIQLEDWQIREAAITMNSALSVLCQTLAPGSSTVNEV